MNSVLIRAVIVVTFALAAYTIAVITEQRKHAISRTVLGFITAGITLDVASTVLMIIGSGKIPITVHGFIGYSALTVMLIDTILIWRFWRKNCDGQVTKGLNLYTRIAYGWWVLAYIAGAVIAMTIKGT
jgi:EamA domain-containing membrane protein RarD